MRNKRGSLKDNIRTQQVQSQGQIADSPHKISKTLPQHPITSKTHGSCLQIPNKSQHIINDHLISTLNPKRTSINLTSFIQVFRKKVRQSSIAREFQNSLQKFKSLSSNRTSTVQRSKGGFVGSCKKQNQLLIENSMLDDRIKKVIISDLEFKERKMKSLMRNSCTEIDRRAFPYDGKGNKICRKQSSGHKKSRRVIKTFSTAQINHEDQSHTLDLQKNILETTDRAQNPQSIEQQKQHKQSREGTHSQQASSIFSNRKLETITTYQRPNLMYNLSLYRKKTSYNVMKTNKKQNATVTFNHN